MFELIRTFCQGRYLLSENDKNYFSFNYSEYVIAFKLDIESDTIEIILKDIMSHSGISKKYDFKWVENRPTPVVVEYMIHSIIKEYIETKIN